MSPTKVEEARAATGEKDASRVPSELKRARLGQ
jgi:hypothetical protein